MSKLWGGRFAKQTDSLVHQFNASISFDARLYDEDITGSIAWAWGLVEAGILTAAEAETIAGGLEQVRQEFATGTFEFAPDDEDVHTAVERRLGELVGAVSGKLHMGRSRNDQVALDVRLYLRRAAGARIDQLRRLIGVLVDAAVADALLPRLAKRLTDAGVELRGCERSRKLWGKMKPASEGDWSEEYLDLILAVKVVDALEAAIEHINTYGSHHRNDTECYSVR